MRRKPWWRWKTFATSAGSQMRPTTIGSTGTGNKYFLAEAHERNWSRRTLSSRACTPTWCWETWPWMICSKKALTPQEMRKAISHMKDRLALPFDVAVAALPYRTAVSTANRSIGWYAMLRWWRHITIWLRLILTGITSEFTVCTVVLN